MLTRLNLNRQTSPILHMPGCATFFRNLIFEPSDSADLHQHKCPHCEVIWEHGANCAGAKKAHRCPECGTLEWQKYYPEDVEPNR